MPYADPALQRAAQRKSYLANKPTVVARVKSTKLAIREYIREYKNKPCADCGMCYPHYVMDLDHLPGFEKKYKPSDLEAYNSWPKVHAELAKCEVVCANCHRVRTFLRSVPVSSVRQSA